MNGCILYFYIHCLIKVVPNGKRPQYNFEEMRKQRFGKLSKQEATVWETWTKLSDNLFVVSHNKDKHRIECSENILKLLNNLYFGWQKPNQSA